MIVKIMGLPTATATHLRHTIPADAHDMLADFRRLLVYFGFFIRDIIVLRTVELDLAAFGAAVDLHIQCSGKDVGPITKERTRLSQLNFFLLYKMQGVPASGAFDLSHC